MRPIRFAVALAAALALPACSGGGSAVTPEASGTARPTPSVSACPPGPSTSPSWPNDVPPDLPRPQGATIVKSQRTPGNLTVVQFRTKHSLREAVLFVVNEFPKKGYALGRGDAEIAEADAPFQRGAMRGLMRMFSVGECETLWVLALGQEGAGVPFDFSYSPRPSASPLPFG